MKLCLLKVAKADVCIRLPFHTNPVTYWLGKQQACINNYKPTVQLSYDWLQIITLGSPHNATYFPYTF